MTKQRSSYTTPDAQNLIGLLGGGHLYQNLTVSQDELAHLRKLYGFTVEQQDTLKQAGADRNLFRHAEHDGLRIIAWLAKFVEPGTDPLKTVVQLAIDSGLDVSPTDIEWIISDDSGEVKEE